MRPSPPSSVLLLAAALAAPPADAKVASRTDASGTRIVELTGLAPVTGARCTAERTASGTVARRQNDGMDPRVMYGVTLRENPSVEYGVEPDYPGEDAPGEYDRLRDGLDRLLRIGNRVRIGYRMCSQSDGAPRPFLDSVR